MLHTTKCIEKKPLPNGEAMLLEKTLSFAPKYITPLYNFGGLGNKKFLSDKCL
jgi:hypothetical protein